MNTPDVLVLGGGNAGLCAAIAAAEAGARVTVLEAAPPFWRGGNTRHTRNCRIAHSAPLSTLPGQYSQEEYWQDLWRVTGGRTNRQLAELVIAASEALVPWLEARGVRFQPALRGTLALDRTNAFFLGGGRAMLAALYRYAAAIGVEIRYEHEVVDLEIDGDELRAAIVATQGETKAFPASAFVAACGGFEANLEALEQAWGEGARQFLVRGTPWNRGTVLHRLLSAGAAAVGDPTQCHAVAIDARGPKFDGGIVTRLDCIPFAIVVNRHAQRFYDEGEDLWPKRYAIWGRLVASCPGQRAWAITDAQALGDFMPTLYPSIEADDIPTLARKIGLDPKALLDTVQRYNAAVRPGRFDPQALDDCHTEGLDPPKSHWARRLERPPFHAWPLAPGITFTYLGLAVDPEMRVQRANGGGFANLFAAGEIMAGNILGQGYLAGIGMTIGSVSGQLAGRGAARHVRG